MGRSVSMPPDSLLVAFAYWIPDYEDENDEPDEFDLRWEWEGFRDSVLDLAQYQFPSLKPCDEWLGREDHALLENNLVYFGISEYCGVAAIWVVAKDQFDGCESLAAGWAKRIEKKFMDSFSMMRKLGTMSNGEAVYKMNEPV